jgi:hypothetical protein
MTPNMEPGPSMALEPGKPTTARQVALEVLDAVHLHLRALVYTTLNKSRRNGLPRGTPVLSRDQVLELVDVMRAKVREGAK